MIYNLIIIFSGFSFAIFFITYSKNKRKNINPINFKCLANYIEQLTKKRKINANIDKKRYQNSNLKQYFANSLKNKKQIKIKYIQLKESFLQFEAPKNNNKKLTYVEQKSKADINRVIKIARLVDIKINRCKEKFRSINNQIIIEIIATSFANALLIEDNFNVFSAFKELSQMIKVYKKEAEILSYLLVQKLITIFFILQREVDSIKQQIIQAKYIKKIRCKKPSSEMIYGIFMFNNSATKLILKNNLNVNKATSDVLQKLDDNLYRQKNIYKYIITLGSMLN